MGWRATGFASSAIVLSFVAGYTGKGASNVQTQAKIGRGRLTSVTENSDRRVQPFDDIGRVRDLSPV